MNWKKLIIVLGTAVYIGAACAALYHAIDLFDISSCRIGMVNF